ncbi:hypothetical protein CHS0354_018757 [Potamilus streckersoni]|uniref:Uncharacterized protein n=1 Tax=Potamilus streckersoni TaxID=2493646 RepID=A0AAE0W5K2_9BIVA|nr:hypothetical protein CHS0354_018757 [Potamilus streckersoni]
MDACVSSALLKLANNTIGFGEAQEKITLTQPAFPEYCKVLAVQGPDGGLSELGLGESPACGGWFGPGQTISSVVGRLPGLGTGSNPGGGNSQGSTESI